MSTKANRKQFQKHLAIVATALLIFSLVISVLLLFDGPRIRKVVYDSAALSRDNNQTIVLRSNQPLEPVDASQVNITPAVNFSVTASGEAVVIQLKQRLKYDTSYTVTVDDLVANNGRSTSFETTIRTDAAQYYVLKRNISLDDKQQPVAIQDKQPDVIKSGRINSESESEAFTAKRILDYAPLNDKLVVQTLQDDDTQKLAIYDDGGDNEKRIEFPEEGTIEQLAVSNNQRFIGFLFSSKALDDGLPKISKNLYVYDSKVDILVPIRSVGSKQPIVSSWRFHPDSSSLIVQTVDNTTYVIDSFGKEDSLPVGTYFSINDISDDGTQMVVGDIANNGPALLTIKDSIAKPYAQQKSGSVSKFISEVQLLQNSKESIQVSDVNEAANKRSYRLYELVKEDKTRRLLEVNTTDAQALNSYLSKNDQYLAVELSDNIESPYYDNYPVRSLTSNIHIVVIDTTTGKTMKETDGFKLIWR